MRRRARECALQILYQLDMTQVAEGGDISSEHVEEAIRAYWSSFEPATEDEREFAERIARGAAAAWGDLDTSIRGVSINWKLSRMDRVDRSLLRMAAYELLYCPDIPRAATINEAIEIAKRYSGNESAAFINGVLDKLSEKGD